MPRCTNAVGDRGGDGRAVKFTLPVMDMFLDAVDRDPQKVSDRLICQVELRKPEWGESQQDTAS